MSGGHDDRASTSTPPRSRALDGVRGIAVVAVVLFHLGLAPSGFMGVDVFFVLSGFLITTILLAEHRRTGTVALGRFYLRRSLRLYPALVVVCTFCLTVALVTGRAVASTSRDALASVLYVSNLVELTSGLLGHTWTLALEEQFYLVWPALLLVGLLLRRTRWRGLWWVPGALVVTGVLVADLATGADGALHSYVRAMGLPLGCVLALVRATPLLRVVARARWAAGVVLLAAFLVPLPAALTTGWPVSIGALLAVPLVAGAAGDPPALLSHPALGWLGLRSYSLYLWHLPLLSLAGNNAPSAIPHPLALGLGLVASVVAAELSYRLVEQRVMRWRDRTVPARSAAEPVHR